MLDGAEEARDEPQDWMFRWKNVAEQWRNSVDQDTLKLKVITWILQQARRDLSFLLFHLISTRCLFKSATLGDVTKNYHGGITPSYDHGKKQLKNTTSIILYRNDVFMKLLGENKLLEVYLQLCEVKWFALLLNSIRPTSSSWVKWHWDFLVTCNV